MRTLNDFLQQTESRRGEAEAGLLRYLFLLALLIWSVLKETGTVSLFLPLILMGFNYPASRLIKLNSRSFFPYVIITLEILLVSLWSLFFNPDGDFPILPLLLYILYGSSLRLKVNLIVLTAIESILMMNLIYMYTLMNRYWPLDGSVLYWPGFTSQIIHTVILVSFSLAVLSRPRIIKSLISQQQIYFDSIRNDNSELRDSLPELSRSYGLSERETQVLSILIQGKTYRMTAGELYISLDTVKSHIKSIYRKCQVGSREELIRVLKAVSGESALVRESESE